MRGTNNRIYQRQVNNDNWSTLTNGRLYADMTSPNLRTWDSDPAAVNSPDGSTKLLAAARQNNMYVGRFANNAWSGWQNLGGPTGNATVCSAPALAQNSVEARLFALGCNGNLYERLRPNAANATWSECSLVAGPPTGTGIFGMVATAGTAGEFEVFATSTNKRLWQLTSTNGVWSGWTQRATGLTTSRPAVAASTVGDGGGRLNVFYRSNSTPYSQVMWMARISDTSWTSPVAISGQYSTLAADMCSVTRMDVIGTMYDGFNNPRGLWHKNWFNP